MARKQILVSDLSGEPIPEGQEAQVSINADGRRYTLDAARPEVESLIAVARAGKRLGRRVKAQA